MTNISNIKIKNFKSIKEMDISLLVNSAGLEKDILFGGFKHVLNKKYGLAAYNVFFGRNSIGKSSVLEALSLVMDFHNDSIANYVLEMLVNEELGSAFNPMANFLMIQNEKNKIATRLQQEIISGQGESFHKYQAKISNIIKNKFLKLSRDKQQPIEICLDFIINEGLYQLELKINPDASIFSGLKNKNDESSKPEQNILREVAEYLIRSVPTSGVHVIQENGLKFEANYTRPSTDDKNAVELSLVNLKRIVGAKKLVNLIKLADPQIDDIVFTKSGNIDVVNKIIVSGTNIDVLSLSVGTRQFIMLLGMIIVRSEAGNCLIMIDEIELSLHKELIDVLKIIMNKLFVDKNMQFLVTAHSPLAVYDFTSFKQIYSISLAENGVHKVERLSAKFKNHQNIINRYLEGDLAAYPDPELSRNIAGELFD